MNSPIGTELINSTSFTDLYFIESTVTSENNPNKTYAGTKLILENLNNNNIQPEIIYNNQKKPAFYTLNFNLKEKNGRPVSRVLYPEYSEPLSFILPRYHYQGPAAYPS